MHREKIKVCAHTLSHRRGSTNENTQMPQPACHLSVDRRNTPATSSQSAFHHSVTTCQLQSPSLRHTALIFTNCAAAWDTTQPYQKYDNRRITPLHWLAYTHPCAHANAVPYMCVSMPTKRTASYPYIADHRCTFLCSVPKAKLVTVLYMISGIHPRLPSVIMTDRFIDWQIVPILHIFAVNPSHNLHSKITIQHPLTFTPWGKEQKT